MDIEIAGDMYSEKYSGSIWESCTEGSPNIYDFAGKFISKICKYLPEVSPFLLTLLIACSFSATLL